MNCDHRRLNHKQGTCIICAIGFNERDCTAFVPAAGETAGEPECLCSSGSPENYEGPARGCPTHGEPEAPDLCEIPHETIEDEDACYAAQLAAQPEAGPCGRCPHPEDEHSVYGCADDCACEWMPPKAPRPPYAVAYELQDGSAFEVALPGDATAGSFNGALIITHASSPVKGLTQVRPMEGTS